MSIDEIRKKLGLELAAGGGGLHREVLCGYCGDLLSDVMANCGKGAVWVTIQGHQNIVAVAVLREMAGIILANGRRPDPETVTKAEQEGIPVLCSPLGAYELAGRLNALGVGGMEQ